MLCPPKHRPRHLVYALPSNISLVPDNAPAAVEQARLLSGNAAGELARAFDNLRHATAEIETLRDAKAVPVGFYQERARGATEFLRLAKLDLDTAMEGLRPEIVLQRERG